MEKSFMSFAIAALIAMGSGGAGYISNVIINGQRAETEVVRSVVRLDTKVEGLGIAVDRVLALVDKINTTATALAIVEIRMGQLEKISEMQARELRALSGLREGRVPRDQREYQKQ